MNNAIDVENISIAYKLYTQPKDRLKEALSPFRKKYHKLFYALKNVTFQVPQGEVVGIVGKNGAGKSTLLKIIAGILQPTTGGVNVHGKVYALLELGSGFNPQFTGLENIFFYGMIHNVEKERMVELTDEIIDFAGIGEFIHQPLKTYSTGMKARLAFAVSTAMQPDILIVDEVLAVGDAQFQKKSFSRMQQLIKGGTTVLFVSHAHQSIIQFCSRAIMLKDGELILDGSPKGVVKLYLKTLDENKKLDKQTLQKELLTLEDKENLLAKNITTELLIPGRDDTNDSKSRRDNTKPKFSDASLEIANANISLHDLYILKNKKRVKTLNHGERYKLFIKYKIETDINNIVFPMSVNNIKGVIISAIRFPVDNSTIPEINNSSYVTIEWSFVASLLPGNYFISVGVTSITDGKKSMLYRMDDAFLFTIVDFSQKIHWGLVSLDQKAESFNIDQIG